MVLLLGLCRYSGGERDMARKDIRRDTDGFHATSLGIAKANNYITLMCGTKRRRFMELLT